MNLFKKPAPRLEPLPPDPGLADVFSVFQCVGSIIPNAMLIMQRRPKVLRAYVQLSRAISDPETSEVDAGFKRLIAHVSSRAAGCRYCMTHTVGLAHCSGVDDAKIEAVWEYRTSPLYTEAERIALDVALAAGGVPNGVTDEMFAKLREHWSDGQIVEIVAMIALFGFLNRWNDTLATPLEDEALALGEKYLAPHGWEAGRHLRSL
ncbi:MAG: carboxymuconolactone decarboxylase family protein [Nitrospirae bacterium]|nr:carboxymuconolactone decarboxylase family protein [Nitrospirota bacterium]